MNLTAQQLYVEYKRQLYPVLFLVDYVLYEMNSQYTEQGQFPILEIQTDIHNEL